MAARIISIEGPDGRALTVRMGLDGVERQRVKAREKQGLSRDELRERIVEIIVEQLGVKPGQCRDEARFVEDLGIG